MKFSILSIVFILSASFEAVANTQYIPNYYRNRRSINIGAALGWSTRHEAGLQFKNSTEKNIVDGSEMLSRSSDEFKGHFFHRLDRNINLGGTLVKSKNKSEFKSPFSNSESESDLTDLVLGGGYEFSEVPMAVGINLSQGVIKGKNNSSQATQEFKTQLAVIGGGYRLPENYFIGANYINANTDGNNTNTTLQIYSIGGGKVFGSLDNPSGAVEVSITRSDSNATSYKVSGLKNLANVQLYSTIQLSADQSRESKKVEIGMDYQFQSFFMGPQISYGTSNSSLESEVELSFETGYRAEDLEIFARIGKTESKDFPDEFIASNEIKTSELVIGGKYLF